MPALGRGVGAQYTPRSQSAEQKVANAIKCEDEVICLTEDGEDPKPLVLNEPEEGD